MITSYKNKNDYSIYGDLYNRDLTINAIAYDNGFIDPLGGINDIKNKIQNGSIILIKNTQELNIIVNYINSKGFNIVPLKDIIKEYNTLYIYPY